MDNNIEQYRNLVELLKQALLFYGNEENFKLNEKLHQSMIEIDNGSQAKFALSKIEETTELLYDDFTKKLDEYANTPSDEMLKLIEEYKKINENVED